MSFVYLYEDDDKAIYYNTEIDKFLLDTNKSMMLKCKLINEELLNIHNNTVRYSIILAKDEDGIKSIFIKSAIEQRFVRVYKRHIADSYYFSTVDYENPFFNAWLPTEDGSRRFDIVSGVESVDFKSLKLELMCVDTNFKYYTEESGLRLYKLQDVSGDIKDENTDCDFYLVYFDGMCNDLHEGFTLRLDISHEVFNDKVDIHCYDNLVLDLRSFTRRFLK